MSTTWYICKYTPVELLEALGGDCQVLDYMPENFDLSDEVSQRAGAGQLLRHNPQRL